MISREPSTKVEYWTVAKQLGWDHASSQYLGYSRSVSLTPFILPLFPPSLPPSLYPSIIPLFLPPLLSRTHPPLLPSFPVLSPFFISPSICPSIPTTSSLLLILSFMPLPLKLYYLFFSSVFPLQGLYTQRATSLHGRYVRSFIVRHNQNMLIFVI